MARLLSLVRKDTKTGALPDFSASPAGAHISVCDTVTKVLLATISLTPVEARELRKALKALDEAPEEVNLLDRARKLARATNNEIGDVEADFLVSKYRSNGIDARLGRNSMQLGIAEKLVRAGVLKLHTSGAYGSDVNLNPLSRYLLADEAPE